MLNSNVVESKPSRLAWVRAHLLKWRLYIAALLCLIVLILESIEHFHDTSRTFWLGSLETLIILGLLVGIVALFETLLRSFSERYKLAQALELKHQLSLRLTVSKDWDELVSLLLDFLNTVTQFELTALYEFDRDQGEFIRSGKLPVDSAHALPRSLQGGGEEGINFWDECAFSLRSGKDCSFFKPYLELTGPDTFFLSLIYDHAPVALILLRKADLVLSAPAVEVINNLGPEMAIALKAAQESKRTAAAKLLAATTSVKLDIAHDLHDTLSQNLCFIHLKLDELYETHQQVRKHNLANELKMLRNVADESYLIVRDTLGTLKNGQSKQLLELLHDYCERVAERSHLAIHINVEGTPWLIAGPELRQVFNICREILNNIEKHAQASRVAICIIWTDEDITLMFEDDGIGFDPEQVDTQSHFGLAFLEERVNSLVGRVLVRSSQGQGTQLEVQLPLAGMVKDIG